MTIECANVATYACEYGTYIPNKQSLLSPSTKVIKLSNLQFYIKFLRMNLNISIKLNGFFNK